MAVNITYTAGNINPIISLPAGTQVTLTINSGSAYVQYTPILRQLLEAPTMMAWPAGTISSGSSTDTLYENAAVQVVVVSGSCTLATVDPVPTSAPLSLVWQSQQALVWSAGLKTQLPSTAGVPWNNNGSVSIS